MDDDDEVFMLSKEQMLQVRLETSQKQCAELQDQLAATRRELLESRKEQLLTIDRKIPQKQQELAELHDQRAAICRELLEMQQVDQTDQDAETRNRQIAKAQIWFLQAADKEGKLSRVQDLLKEGLVDANFKDERGYTALHRAAERDDLDLASLLVTEWHANPDARCNRGMTPLHCTCGIFSRRIMYKVGKFLLEQGADSNAQDEGGDTLLHHISAASGRGEDNLDFTEHIKLCKLLIAHGADVNAKSKRDGYTPLHCACHFSRLSIARFLVRKGGADIHAQDEDGSTPLHLACDEGNLKLVKFLVKKGANVAARATEGLWGGKTPLDVASKWNHQEVVDFLQSHLEQLE